MRRHNTNPSKVSSGWRIFEIFQDLPEDVDVRAVPLADPAAVAELAGDATDLARLMVVIDRESPLAIRIGRIGGWLAAYRASSSL